MCRRISAALLAAAFLAAVAAAQQPSSSVRVRKGTLLKLETLQPLDPATVHPGDDVPLLLARPLYVEGAVLLPAGELLHGVVTRVKPAGSKCKWGEVAWKLDRITFADASSVRTAVGFKSPRQNDHVPMEKPKSSCNPADCVGLGIQDAVLGPIMAVGLAEHGAVKLVKKPFQGSNACSRYTRDIPLPAHSTVALEIMEDHEVRY